MSNNILIKTTGLKKKYRGVTAVDKLDMEVGRKQIFGFLGPNASGKTTTINMLLGLVRPTSGTIELFGQDTRHNLSILLRRVGAVIENSLFYSYISGKDNLEIFARMIGGISATRIGEVLQVVKLADRAKDKVKTYSLGMRQRLALAAALLNDPELIIMDEPTNGLDPSGISDIRELIRELSEQGKTIFLSSHLLHEVEQVCDHVTVINKGKILTSGPVSELLSGKKKLHLRVSDTAGAISLLKNIEWIKTVVSKGEYLYVEAPEERSAAVYDILVKSGIGISEMQLSGVTLEEFFLDTLLEKTDSTIGVKHV